MNRKWIGTSWKMNKTKAQAQLFCDGLKSWLSDNQVNDIQCFVIPPFTYLDFVASQLESSDVKVGAQNMAWAENGAFTGEISAEMLTDCGATIVELGHSERREYFAETDERVNAKVKTALKHKLKPLICVGDTLEQKHSGCSVEAVLCQVKQSLVGLSLIEVSNVILAYEPVWAIGEHGQAASIKDVELVHCAIKAYLKSLDHGLVDDVPLLYGGSVNPSNARDLIDCEFVDGLFIGRSAWQVEGYTQIIRLCQ
ncbi:triose-phosphate isomerase [Alginatibacterium sediminis]|uniref:Triosephosphate isomerase n=1 Tax=Alginatibacterium sediminis TaxID=2164068 RepID=A0A420EHR9_9ALTE|nr:triose-phosphate isomerase [Alginatibacterium sediminis]RKF20291.1 triose-phosphate isomerase [Alginatibacterium sediminis]